MPPKSSNSSRGAKARPIRGVSDKARKRRLRLSQTVAPFGVGNIYDFLGESFVACDTMYWQHHGAELVAPRLAAALGVATLRSAPIQSDAPWASPTAGVPFHRFPGWLFCQTCRSMTRWHTGREKKGEVARCPSCKKATGVAPQLVPMRFVVACNAGHLGDVQWDRWAHLSPKHDAQRRCQSDRLKFVTVPGRGSGLKSLEVRCVTCSAANSLQGIASKGSLRRLGVACSGKQPWQKSEQAIQCVEAPQVLQRGASNLYYSTVVSALDIPPHSDYSQFSDLSLRITTKSLFRTIMDIPDGALREQLVSALAADVGCSKEEVRAVVRREEVGASGTGATSIGGSFDLETDEWFAFISPQKNEDERNSFLTKHTSLLGGPQDVSELPQSVRELNHLVGNVVLASRLREVRALASFSRILPEKTKLKPGLDHDIDWLPAIEVFGEGIFLTLDEKAVCAWESRPAVVAAAAELERRRLASLLGPRLRAATPRFVLLHTFAHLLMRQLTFECGYSSSSLRERIYSRTPDRGEPQAGLLIYTAAGDVEGTMGGLVRQGEPPRLYRTILSAVERGAWCSADPICRESQAQGFQGLNRGACHACSLVAETSCDTANALLDRSFLIGGLGGVTGFFERMLSLAASDVLSARSAE